MVSRITISPVIFQMASWNLSSAFSIFTSDSWRALTASAEVSTFLISLSISFSQPFISSSSSSLARSNIPDTFPEYSFLWERLAKNLLESFLTQLGLAAR